MADLTPTGGLTARHLTTLDTITAVATAELAHLRASTDTPGDDEPGRDALDARLRNLLAATAELQHPAAPRPGEPGRGA